MPKIYYLDRKSGIFAVLKRVAVARKTITYQELGRELGIPQTGPWKGVLDSLALDENKAGRPDITFLAVRKSTGYPGQIGFESSIRPTAEQKRTADQTFLKVWEYYAGD